MSREEHRRTVAQLRGPWGLFQQTIEDMAAEGDRAAVRCVARATHQGELHHPGLPPIPPSGETVTWEIMQVFRLRDGQVVELWEMADRLGRLQQLGATILPPVQVSDG